MVELLKSLGGLAGLAALALWALAHRELVRLEAEDPLILRTAGIQHIDWWFRCVVGVFKLAFGSVGSSLATRRRRLFQLMWIAILIAIVLLAIASRLESVNL